jgi:serine/threonine protein kinase
MSKDDFFGMFQILSTPTLLHGDVESFQAQKKYPCVDTIYYLPSGRFLPIDLPDSHRNIATLKEIGNIRGRQFFVEEYAEGLTLESLANKLFAAGGKLPEEIVVSIAASICAGLCYLENTNTFMKHWSLQPAHIHLSNNGEVRLLFTGVLRAGIYAETIAEAINGKGTLFIMPPTDYLSDELPPPISGSYFSPEEYRLGEKERSSVIFHMGILLYEMLSGRSPFDNENVMQGIISLVSGSQQPLRERVPSLSPKLCDIVEKAMQLPADQRHQSPFELEQELRAFLGTRSTPPNCQDIGAFVRQMMYAGEAPYGPSSDLIQEELERISCIDWLHPDAEAEALSQEFTEWIEARFDEHLSLLQFYAVDQYFPPSKVEFTRSLYIAQQRTLIDGAIADTPEMLTRRKAISGLQYRIERICNASTKLSNLREETVQRAILASSPKRSGLQAELFSSWWLTPKQAPPEAVLRAHISHLFVFGRELPSPWDPFIAMWERGIWPVAVVAGGLWSYIPIYKGQELQLMPDGAPQVPLVSLPCWLHDPLD